MVWWVTVCCLVLFNSCGLLTVSGFVLRLVLLCVIIRGYCGGCLLLVMLVMFGCV